METIMISRDAPRRVGNEVVITKTIEEHYTNEEFEIEIKNMEIQKALLTNVIPDTQIEIAKADTELTYLKSLK